MSDQDRVLRVVKGAVGAPGVAVGLAYAVDRGRLTVPMRLAGPDSAAGESARMRLAVEESRGQLTAALGREIADEHKQIIEAYITWLQDPSLIEEAERLIAEEGINAEWAVKKLFDGLKSSVDPQDERARSERVHLFDEIGHRILRNLMGVHQESLETIPAGVILVAHNISPGDMALVDRHRIAGLAMDIGGSTSHTSILARGMGIPTVVGLDHVTSVIQTGDLVILDATLGLVVVNPDLEQVDKYQAKARRLREARQALLEFRDLPSRTQDGVDIRIMANIELPDEIPLMFEHGLRDVGLFRSEFIFLARGVPATEEEQFEIYARMLRDVGPDHVLTVRTLDLGMEKVFADVRAPTEANPAMGLRAIRFCLQSEDLFKDQLRALMRASVYGRLRIMFPHDLRPNGIAPGETPFRRSLPGTRPGGPRVFRRRGRRHHDRSPQRRADGRPVGARGRFFQHRDQRSDSIHAGRRPRQRSGFVPVHAVASGGVAPCSRDGRSGPASRRRGLHVRGNGGRYRDDAASARPGRVRFLREPGLGVATEASGRKNQFRRSEKFRRPRDGTRNGRRSAPRVAERVDAPLPGTLRGISVNDLK
ncbi:MAG: PEP-utilizing enzyme [Deltaproteobacteria bacterium]|nr:PEP-utilizing enzyme [Deltaproteobacteria bacterium]